MSRCPPLPSTWTTTPPRAPPRRSARRWRRRWRTAGATRARARRRGGRRGEDGLFTFRGSDSVTQIPFPSYRYPRRSPDRAWNGESCCCCSLPDLTKVFRDRMSQGVFYICTVFVAPNSFIFILNEGPKIIEEDANLHTLFQIVFSIAEETSQPVLFVT